VEHRLFGALRSRHDLVQAAVVLRTTGSFTGSRQWNGMERDEAPDTLLGPEGSGASSTSGRLSTSVEARLQDPRHGRTAGQFN